MSTPGAILIWRGVAWVYTTKNMIGGGKYDKEATDARAACAAEGVMLIVLNGKDGSGFSVQLPPHAVARIPVVLRQMADQIEADVNRITSLGRG